MPARIYDVDIGVFDAFTPVSTYLLGYILADGNVNKRMTSMTIVSVDREHLLRIRDVFCPDIVLHTRAPNPLSERTAYSLIVNSTALVRKLYGIGIHPAKSYDGPYLTIPDELFPSFFLGVLDGDGNILYGKRHGLRITIAGNYNAVIGLQQQLARFGLKSSTKFLTDDRCKLLFMNGEDAGKILSMAYAATPLFLERKRRTFDAWLAHTTIPCDLCGNPIAANGRGKRFCEPCGVTRQRLMNRRQDHFIRYGVRKPFVDLATADERLLNLSCLYDRAIKHKALAALAAAATATEDDAA